MTPGPARRRIGACRSSSASVPTLDRSFLEDLAHRRLDAWNRHDAEGPAELCTPGIDFTDPAIGTVHGRAAVADWVRMCNRAFPDYRFEEPEPPLLAADRPKAIVPCRMRGPAAAPEAAAPPQPAAARCR